MRKIHILISVFLLSGCQKENHPQVIESASIIPFSVVQDKVHLSEDALVEYEMKYQAYDKDIQKITDATLFESEPQLSVPQNSRVYLLIRDLHEGANIADQYMELFTKDVCLRHSYLVKNMYVYYYEVVGDPEWYMCFVLSKHTGEVLFYRTSYSGRSAIK